MPFEPYASRYQGKSHQELYNLLHAGQNGQVLGLSTRWGRMRESAQDLTSTLQQDLSKLTNSWTGEAALEFHRRITSIVQFTSWVADEFDQISNATGIMGAQLEDAKSRAEPPHDSNDHMISNAATNAATFSILGPAGSTVGGILGAFQGHQQDEEERQRAHQRMVNLVADLAADYDRNAEVSFSTDLPSPPPELPGAIELGVGGAAIGAIVGAIAAMGLFGSGGSTAARHITQATGHVDVNTQGGSTTHDAAGVGLTGTGALVGVHDSGQPHHGGVDISDGVLLAGGGGLALGLGLAARSAMNSGGATGVTGTAGASMPARPGMPADAVLGREPDPNAAANARTGAVRPANGIASGRSSDEPEEHSTWLTEDDMDWGEDDAAEPILGGRPAGTDSRVGGDDESARRDPTFE
jgi:uncharacterized protein YukE